MKTYEIKMNRSRWTSLLIGILCILLVVMLCTPYFTYGKVTTSMVPADGDDKLLFGRTWTLNGVEEGTDGYQKIDIQDGKEKSTLYTTNILRVNQKATLATLTAAIDNYNEIATACEKSDEYLVACQGEMDAFKAYYEGEKANYVPAAEGAEPNEAQAAFLALEKAYTNASKKLDEAIKMKDTANAQLVAAKAAVDQAYAAADKAFAQDASYAWVTETTAAYNDALLEAYPEEAKIGFAEAKLDAFKTWLSEKYADEFATFEGKKALNNFYEAHNKTAEDYDEFFKANEVELTAEEIVTSAEKVKEVLAGKMSDADRDELVIGKLNGMKAVSAEAAAEAAAAQKATDAALKAGAQKQTSDKAKKDYDAIVKAFADYKVVPENDEETEEAEPYKAAEIAKLKIDGFEKNFKAIDSSIKEDTLMKSACTVKLKKGVLTIDFANGETKTDSFASYVNYDSEKTLSLLGYVGFPYNHDEFTTEAAYAIKDYYINDVVLLPIILGLLGVLGLVIAILKRDSFGVGICPVLAGIIGIIGYCTSTFLKMGDRFTMHIIFYCILLVVGGLHLGLGIRDWNNKRLGK